MQLVCGEEGEVRGLAVGCVGRLLHKSTDISQFFVETRGRSAEKVRACVA